MSISATVRRLSYYVVIILAMTIITTSKPQANSEDECFYYFIQQPSSNVSCNPWPYIVSYSGNTLVLHCDLLGPQNNDIPNVEWYRSLHSHDGDDSKPKRVHHGSSKGKFSTPTSSGDISSGFKRINFTLFVNDMNEADAGCYWCEIRANAKKRSFPMKQSSVFCLQKASEYEDRENCPILPVNNSVVCASDTTCEHPLPNWLGDPYLIINDIINRSEGSTQVPSPSQPIIPANIATVLTDIYIRTTSVFSINSIISPLNSLRVSQQSSMFMRHSTQSTSFLSYRPVSGTNQVSLVPTTTSTPTLLTNHILHQISPAADYVTKVTDLSPSNTVMATSNDYQQVTVVPSSSINIVERERQSNSTMDLSLHLTLVQVSVFIGVGVCTVLFAVISVLVFGVVMLCRKSTPKSSSRSNHMHLEGEGHHMLSNSPAELISTVWRRELEASPVRTSVVNTEHVLPPSPAPSYSSIRVAVTNEDDNTPHNRDQDQPLTSPTLMSLPVTSQMTSVPMPTLPSHINMEFRWRAYSLPLLTERTGTINHGVSQLRCNQHHLSIEGNRESRLDYQQIESTAASVSSPELHYYHVLERPEYYNCIWLEGEDGHELLLGNRTNKSNQQRVTFKEDDSDSDSQYHWRVVLTSSGQEDDAMDRSTSSSKRVGRHLYRRLDHSTLEPLKDYAKVSIASGHHDSDGDLEQSLP